MRLAFVATLLAGSALAGPAFAADGDIRTVVLSSGGLAEITRQAEVGGGTTEVSIEVPLEQVDDVLKSLVVRDPKGGVAGLRLGGPDTLAETFRSMPFSPEDLASVAGLARGLQGTEVSATSGGRTVSGVVLGVSERREKDEATVQVLSVLTKDGTVEALALGPDASVAVLDPAMREKLARATAALGKSKADGARTVVVGLTDGPKRTVAVSYVVAAPIWKTAYRVVTGTDGSARLQAWAVVENATADDWKGVSVVLSSGAPVTLRQRLHSLYWRDRPEVPVDVAGVTAPPPDTGPTAVGGALGRLAQDAAKSAFAAAPAPMTEAAEMAMDMPISAAVQTTAAVEGDVAASYPLPAPVDLAAGETLSVPIVDREIPAERIGLYRPQSGSPHPVAAVMLTNDTGAALPPGILTVYDGRDGYVGDASILPFPAGEQRMASFAADRKVTVREEQTGDQSIASLKVVDGIVEATYGVVSTTTYRIKGAADGERTIVIEHPARDGWTLSVKGGEEMARTATHNRLKVKVPAGATAAVEAVERRTDLTRLMLADVDQATLELWSETAPDEAMREKLAELIAARREAAAAESKLAEIDERTARIVDDQGRLRQNLSAVPSGSELAERYLASLAGTEDELGRLADERGGAETTLRRLRDAVDAVIRSF
ncbi:DUF4139 domain-containing protein [Chthonobacter albigriseus]|uniref:DUF4139 domain-containing protein n=1 Tax=Chthonobacter albigriseus TaxID=1683161 RepID=UPI0015EFA86C|nr:DUF4139 domain-containing protein [Chthonobacter albigriseus]